MFHQQSTKNPMINVIETEPLFDTFIHSVGDQSNIFIVRAHCEIFDDEMFEWRTKSVAINLKHTKSSAQMISFRDLCWNLKEFGLELKLDIVKRRKTELVILMFSKDVDTLQENLLGMVTLIGNLEKISKNPIVELESQFLFKVRKNSVDLQPMKVHVSRQTRWVGLQPENSVRPLAYRFQNPNRKMRFFQFGTSLLIEVSIDFEETEYIIVFCLGYFEYVHAFPSISLEFENEILLIEKLMKESFL